MKVCLCYLLQALLYCALFADNSISNYLAVRFDSCNKSRAYQYPSQKETQTHVPVNGSNVLYITKV